MTSIQQLRQLYYQPGARLLAARNAIAILRTKHHTYVADNLDEFVNDALAMRNALPHLLDIAEAGIALRKRVSENDAGEWDWGRWNESAAFDEALARLDNQ